MESRDLEVFVRGDVEEFDLWETGSVHCKAVGTREERGKGMDG